MELVCILLYFVHSTIISILLGILIQFYFKLRYSLLSWLFLMTCWIDAILGAFNPETIYQSLILLLCKFTFLSDLLVLQIFYDSLLESSQEVLWSNSVTFFLTTLNLIRLLENSKFKGNNFAFVLTLFSMLSLICWAKLVIFLANKHQQPVN
jgi:hypothetical protein